jgi:hypothetical protein
MILSNIITDNFIMITDRTFNEQMAHSLIEAMAGIVY